MNAFNLEQAAAFLQMNAEELRARAKRGAIPGAKIGRRWVFLEDDLVEHVRSKYVAMDVLPTRGEHMRAATKVWSRAAPLNPATTQDVLEAYEELMHPSHRKTQSRHGRRPRLPPR